MYCRNCNKKVRDNDKFCPYCGSEIKKEWNTKEFANFYKDSLDSEVLEERRSGKGKGIFLLLGGIVVIAVVAIAGKIILGGDMFVGFLNKVNSIEKVEDQTNDIPYSTDEKNTMTKANSYKNIVSIKKQTFHYDDNANIDCIGLSEYDEHVNEIKLTWFDTHDEVTSWWEYEYDSNGNMLKSALVDIDNTPLIWFECVCDSNGNVIKRTRFDINHGNEPHRYSEYKYDSYGNMIKSITFNVGGDVQNYREYVYEYDMYQNFVKKEVLDSDGQRVDLYEYEYEYDDNGNMLKSKEYHYGKLEYETEYVLIEVPVRDN